MRDLFIVLPGIMGSVLRRGDDNIWDPGPGMVKRLFGKSRWVQSLALGAPADPGNPNPIDGVTATALVDSQSVIPGFSLIEGYTELHDALAKTFGDDLIEGNSAAPFDRLDGEPPSHGVPNYFRFPYDWRRDLRSAAIRLDDLIRPALQALRDQRSPDAKVHFIAHSMGGLVARYWIEGIDLRTGTDFDGWKLTRELLTFGTPHRGSLDAVSNLVNGTKVIDFRPALVGMPGAYQLLPRYPCLLDSRSHGDRKWHYPKDLSVTGIDPSLATSAFDDFHKVIQNGAERHQLEPDYPHEYIVPLIGFGHGTLNSLELTDDGLKLSHDVPPALDSVLSDGDGTVPAVSAFPIELDNDRSPLRYVNQQHGSLQTDKRVLASEILRIRHAQADTSAAALSPTERNLPITGTQGLGMAGLAIDHSEIVMPDEAATVTVTALNTDVDSISLTLTHLETGAVTSDDVLPDVAWTNSLPPGEYRIDATAAGLATKSGLFVLDDELAGI